MNRQITLAQYRTIDLGILAAVLAGSQLLICIAGSFWFSDQLYTVSPVAAVTALVMMRWGPWAAVHAVAGGLLFTALSGGTGVHYLIYGAGNLLAMGALVLLRCFGKERIRSNVVLSLLFALAVQAMMLLGRAITAYLVGFPLPACWGFVTTDVLSALFTLLIIWTARRVDGLFEDQKSYLLRLEQERQNERRDQF